MKQIKSLLIAGLVLMGINLSAQNQSDMRLNEYLVYNTDDFQDDFGQQNAWFELFNVSYGTVNIGGCYLSNDINNLQKYIIPKGDVLTSIKPRQHVLFWADNQPYRGTFHTNFTLAESDTIYFVSSDGRTIIDRIAIQKDIEPNLSYGRTQDGIGSVDGNGEGWQFMSRTSPSTNNAVLEAKSKSAVMAELDPNGGLMALTAMSVVFLALIILFFVFKTIGKLATRNQQHKSDVATEGKITTVKAEENTGEAIAAISTALYLYAVDNEAHDEESFQITMKHTDRSYSPWSSKIYTLRQNPQVKKN
ncbi:MAG: OadG family protein [Bacteroidales bacterium]|nr:OadG family protein [Bacteroidales bacterium]